MVYNYITCNLYVHKIAKQIAKQEMLHTFSVSNNTSLINETLFKSFSSSPTGSLFSTLVMVVIRDVQMIGQSEQAL